MVASVLVGFIALSFSISLAHAGRFRADARLRGAAMIRANALMEAAIAYQDVFVEPHGYSGFLTPGMVLTDIDPSTANDWVFDGEGYRQLISVNNNQSVWTIRVEIFCDPNRPVRLQSQVFIQP